MEIRDQIISVSNLSYGYSSQTLVLKEITFTLAQNRSMGIIGPNGAGKTTLLYALSGLINVEGSVQIDGMALNKKSKELIRKKISFVFQNPDDQLFMPTVYEDIAFGLDQLGFTTEEIEQQVQDVLIQVNMAGYETKNAHHLSLGQKKRICLAAALARRSSLMLFDEPTNELDPHGRREFIRQLKNITASKIIASHDLNLILEICDEVLLLNKQQIIAHDRTDAILGNEPLMEANMMEVPSGIYLGK